MLTSLRNITFLLDLHVNSNAVTLQDNELVYKCCRYRLSSKAQQICIMKIIWLILTVNLPLNWLTI